MHFIQVVKLSICFKIRCKFKKNCIKMKQIINRAQRAIIDLDIRVDNNPYDKLQLAEILVDILDYPDLVLARSHQLANKIGNYDLFQNRSQLALDLQQNQKTIDGTPICECCGLIIHKQSVPFCTPLADINLGLGTRLYLNNVLYNVLIFLIVTIVFSIHFVISNVRSCSESMELCGIQSLGLSYKIIDADNHKGSLYASSILGIITVSIWGVIQVIKNHKEKQIGIELTVKFIQASEFTLMLEKFPLNMLKDTYEENLQMFTQIFKNYEQRIQAEYGDQRTRNKQGHHAHYKVAKINIARNLYVQREKNFAQQQQLKNALKQKQDTFRQWILYRRSHNRFYSSLHERELYYSEYLNFYTNEFDKQETYHGKQDQSVIVFVTLEDSQAREEVENYEKAVDGMWWNVLNICNKNLFPVDGVIIKKAPPPQEIKWTNIGFPYKIKLLRIVLVYGVSLLFLAGSLAMTYGLNQVQDNNPNLWISILISIVITGVNISIQFLIMFLSKYLNQITQSNIQFNIAFKICLFEILNVIGVPLLALYISKRNLYGQNGLSQDIFFIALFNILPPLGRFIDPYHILITLRNKLYSRPQYRLKHFQSQKQFNKIYQDNDFDLGYEYAYVIKTSIFTAFFMCLQPIITVFAVTGLMIMYFVNKYRLLYRFYKPRYFSSTVNALVSYLLALSPLFFGLGMLVFINWQHTYYFQGTLYLNWVIFIIGGFFLFFPFRILYRCINQPKLPELKFSQQKATLPSQYDRMNPITKSKAIDQHQSYLKQLQAHKLLSPGAKIFNQSFIRMTNQQIRRSRMYAMDQLKTTMKSRMQQNGMRNSSDVMLQNPSTLQGVHYTQKPDYNQNIASYENLIKTLNTKDGQ